MNKWVKFFIGIVVVGAVVYGSMYYYATRVHPRYVVHGVVPIYGYEMDKKGDLTVSLNITVNNSFVTVTMTPTGGVGIFASNSPAYYLETCFDREHTSFLKFLIEPSVFYKSRGGNTYYFDDVTVVDASPYYYVSEKSFHRLCGVPYFGRTDTWLTYSVGIMKP